MVRKKDDCPEQSREKESRVLGVNCLKLVLFFNPTLAIYDYIQQTSKGKHW